MSLSIKFNILRLVAREFGETNEPTIEDDFVSFEVYKDAFENAPKLVTGNSVKLILLEKFDDPFFRLVYSIKHR